MQVDSRTELVIAADVAKRLGLSPQRVNVLATASGFPKPLGKLGRSAVWRWSSVERWDLDLAGRAITVARAFSDGRLRDAKTLGSRRRVPLTQRAVDALEALPPRLDVRLFFSAPMGGYLNLGNFRRPFWQPALESGGFVRCPLSAEHIAKRVGREYRCEEPGCDGRASAHRIYDLRHTFASWALAANLSMFELARFMGTSVKIIDRHYGHLVSDSETIARERLDAYGARN